MGILNGVDLLEIDRIKKILDSRGESFKNRVFTEDEIKYCESRKSSKYESYAARFCAKEAFVKAIGSGIRDGIEWQDIEVYNDYAGKPYLKLHRVAKEKAEEIGVKSISISLAHCKNYAISQIVIETND